MVAPVAEQHGQARVPSDASETVLWYGKGRAIPSIPDSHRPPRRNGCHAGHHRIGRVPPAQQYLRYGFTTQSDLGSMDIEFPTIDLRDAIQRQPGVRAAPVVAPHAVSASAGHGGISGFYASRWGYPRLCYRRRSHPDPPEGAPRARPWGRLDQCGQLRRLLQRRRRPGPRHLVDEKAIDMAMRSGVCIVPTMQMTRDDLSQLQAGTLPFRPRWPTGPTAPCSPSATASWSSRRWSRRT